MSQYPTPAQIKPGQQLPEMSVTISQKMIIMGAVSSRDWQPIHHNVEWAQQHAGLPNIIMNNYTQAGWISRYITDWSGPNSRLGRLKFAMRKPICPGDIAVFNGVVAEISQEGDLLWLDMDIGIFVTGKPNEGKPATKGSARLALPATSDSASPWQCTDTAWRP